MISETNFPIAQKENRKTDWLVNQIRQNVNNCWIGWRLDRCALKHSFRFSVSYFHSKFCRKPLEGGGGDCLQVGGGRQGPWPMRRPLGVSYKAGAWPHGVECKHVLNKTEIQNWTEDRMGNLAAFPMKIAGAAAEVIKLPEPIHKVPKTRLELGDSACSGSLLWTAAASLLGLKPFLPGSLSRDRGPVT